MDASNGAAKNARGANVLAAILFGLPLLVCQAGLLAEVVSRERFMILVTQVLPMLAHAGLLVRLYVRAASEERVRPHHVRDVLVWHLLLATTQVTGLWWLLSDGRF